MRATTPWPRWFRAVPAFTVAACLFLGACGAPRRQPIPRPTAALPFIKAITDVAYNPQVFCSADSDQDLADIAATGANWVVLGPVWNQVDLSSTAIQPWIKTTKDSCLLHAMIRAHALGLSIAVKPYDDPQNNKWRALIEPADWNAWFAWYTGFIDHYATWRGRAGRNSSWWAANTAAATRRTPPPGKR